MGQKACKNVTGVGIRLCLKYKGDACRNVNMMSGHTDRQTDRQMNSSLFEGSVNDTESPHDEFKL